MLASFALLVACQSGPPVQEMSDARMAIAAAREAGAEQHAADQLQTAEEYLGRAEQRLNEKAYSQARRDANFAHRSAMDALSKLTDESESDGPDE
jgi:uncharacterized protein DUF4398